MFLSDFSTIGYHDFLRKLRRNRAVWLVCPKQFTFGGAGARKFRREEYSMCERTV